MKEGCCGKVFGTDATVVCPALTLHSRRETRHAIEKPAARQGGGPSGGVLIWGLVCLVGFLCVFRVLIPACVWIKPDGSGIEAAWPVELIAIPGLVRVASAIPIFHDSIDKQKLFSLADFGGQVPSDQDLVDKLYLHRGRAGNLSHHEIIHLVRQIRLLGQFILAKGIKRYTARRDPRWRPSVVSKLYDNGKVVGRLVKNLVENVGVQFFDNPRALCLGEYLRVFTCGVRGGLRAFSLSSDGTKHEIRDNNINNRDSNQYPFWIRKKSHQIILCILSLICGHFVLYWAAGKQFGEWPLWRVLLIAVRGGLLIVPGVALLFFFLAQLG